MDIAAYLEEVRAKHQSGLATEHSYRPALEKLFRSIERNLEVINEPRRVDVGAPDFVFTRGPITIGWAEAKDLDKDILHLKDYSMEQKERYRKGLPNLIYTNGIDFEFIRNGESVRFVSIAEFLPGLPSKEESFEELARQLRDFSSQTPISITSATKLASLMAGKAAIIKDVMGNVLKKDKEQSSPLGKQYKAFKADLLPHLELGEFADIYAETITYGMFAARLHDTTLDSFSRVEALELLPRSNPFLRSLFGYIAGPDLDDRIRWIIDDLANILRASDPSLLFKDFGKFSARNDPFIHFYEDFLKAYNPAKRKSRGVWYTPEPVVDFIVRSVDNVLKSEFRLKDGLADTSMVTVDHDTGQTNLKTGKAVYTKKEVHRVQILDPATGTGTFLAKSIQLIADRVKSRASGKWSGYVEEDLIPRLHGLELLMASYAMCHMKLDMVLRGTGYAPSERPPRLSVWLTNTLEPGEREVRDLFFTALADEARGASDVKRNKPIMCVIGNPPYSGESSNKGKWITNLMADYKFEPQSKKALQEKNTKWINKDEHKFIRLAEAMIAKTGSGVVGFISSHGYLSDPTMRGMRWHLLQSFDRIYVLDLHGNANRKEVSPDGSPDKNVFDIKQGVAVVIAVKNPARPKQQDHAEVQHSDVWGSRESKNALLWSGEIDWTPVALRGPHWAFLNRDADIETRFATGFALNELFETFGNGIVTKRDQLCIQPTSDAVWKSLVAFKEESEEVVRARYSIPEDVRDWTYQGARADVISHFDRSWIQSVNYRPFDQRKIFYTGNARGFVGWPVKQVMSHYLVGPNIGLLAPKASRDRKYAHCLVTDIPSEAIFLSGTTGSNAMNFPLYVYSPSSDGKKKQLSFTEDDELPRQINFSPKIYADICKAAGISKGIPNGVGTEFRTATGKDRPSEVQVLDYVYGVLHAPAYRETFAEFLKIGFPRIPFPLSPKDFERVSSQGERLRRLHLMEDDAIGAADYPYVGDGNDVVGSDYPKMVAGNLYVNPTQYFSSVPTGAWSMLIGGYYPAQKWLKDRRGTKLSWSDITHYQKVLKVLSETALQMNEIRL